MKTRFFLPPPKEKDAVEYALNYHHLNNRYEHQFHAANWVNTHYFLQGVRNLKINGWDSRLWSGGLIDASGQRHVRVERAVDFLQVEQGRIMSLDLSPYVERPRGLSLDGLRGTALSQTALDNFWYRFNHVQFQLGLAYGLPSYGTMGIGAFDVGDTGIFGATLMLVNPWELRPLPSAITNITEVAGIEWCRWVPYEWIKENFRKILRLPKGSDEQDLEMTMAPIGSKVHNEFAPISRGNPSAQAGVFGGSINAINMYNQVRASRQIDDKKTNEKYVQMREFWIHGDDYSCLRWIVTLGRRVVLDLDYTNERQRLNLGIAGAELPVAPLHIARYLTVGSFYGRALIDRVIQQNKVFEAFLGDAIQNVRDHDRFRFLAMPISMGITNEQICEYMKNKVIPYQPDMSTGSHRPEIISPPNLSDFPGKMSAYLDSVMEKSALQGNMFRGKAPGRVDSAGGLALLAEQQGVPMVPVGESIKEAMTGVFKALHGIIRRNIQADTNLLLNRIDESIVGVKLDLKTGTTRLTEPGALPKPQDLRITVRSVNPRSKVAVKQELDDLLKRKVITPVQYRITAIKENLDLPILNRSEYESYCAAWVENIVMFGDGETPGSGETNPDADNHAIHFLVLMEFMNGPVFRIASAAVQQVFLDHKDYHLENLGALPEGLESIDQFGQVGPPGPMVQQAFAAGGPPPMLGQASPMAAMGMG